MGGVLKVETRGDTVAHLLPDHGPICRIHGVTLLGRVDGRQAMAVEAFESWLDTIGALDPDARLSIREISL